MITNIVLNMLPPQLEFPICPTAILHGVGLSNILGVVDITIDIHNPIPPSCTLVGRVCYNAVLEL